jgi:hypothetical protein
VSANLGSVCVLPPSSTCRVLVCRFAGFLGGGRGKGGRVIDSVQFVLIEEPSKIRSKRISRETKYEEQARLPIWDRTASFHLFIESTTHGTKTGILKFSVSASNPCSLLRYFTCQLYMTAEGRQTSRRQALFKYSIHNLENDTK